MVLMAIFGTADAFFQPAFTGLMPAVVSPARLQEANAVRGLALSRLRPTVVERAAEAEPTLLEGLRSGFAEVRSRSWVQAFLGLLCAYHVVVLPSMFVLGPVLADRELGGASSWALVTAAFGVGSIVGDLLVLRFKPSRPLLVAAIAFVNRLLPGGDRRLGNPGGRDRGARGGHRRRGERRLHAVGDDAAGADPGAFDLPGVELRLPGQRRLAADRLRAGRRARGAIGLHELLALQTVVGVPIALAVLAVPAVRAIRRGVPALRAA